MSFFSQPLMVSSMVDAAQTYLLGKQAGEQYIVEMQRQMAARMAEKIAAEVAKSTTMKAYERPDRYATEYQMRYDPPESRWSSGTLTSRAVPRPDWNTCGTSSSASDTITWPDKYAMLCEHCGRPKMPDSESAVIKNKSFAGWYRELKDEIDKWLN